MPTTLETTPMDSFQAQPVPPFATLIPERRERRKTHVSLAKVKNALVAGPWFKPEYSNNASQYAIEDGVFAGKPITIYRLEPLVAHYDPWITINPGDRRSHHVALVPFSQASINSLIADKIHLGTSANPLHQLRTLIYDSLTELGLTYTQLVERANNHILTAAELNLWGLVRGAALGRDL